MEVTGAIFDCDGTILDSMGPWDRIFIDLLADEGHPGREDLVILAESMNVHDECVFLHDVTGAGDSGEDLYEKLKARLKVMYATQVKPFPKVRDFLEGLRSRGIPMVIATTTEAEDVRSALAAHGLDGYFEAIVSSSDLGIGKEFPDVYERSLARLGTSKETTPVFEDAPFACETASKAGFTVVGFVRPGDRRDLADFEPWCAQVADSWEAVDLEAL